MENTWSKLKACNKVKNAYKSKLERAILALETLYKTEENAMRRAQIRSALVDIKGSDNV